jgi:hypothetical protein
MDEHLSTPGKRRTTAIDARTTRHGSYDITQRGRKHIEEIFGWIMGSAGLTKVKLRGRDRVNAVLALAVYNLIRLPSSWRHQHEHPRQMVRRRDPRLRYGRGGRPHPFRRGGRRVRLRLPHRLHSRCLRRDAVNFDWQGNDEIEPATGDGWAELQDDGFLKGEFAYSTATKSRSSHVVRGLNQQPARSRCGPKSLQSDHPPLSEAHCRLKL